MSTTLTRDEPVIRHDPGDLSPPSRGRRMLNKVPEITLGRIRFVRYRGARTH